MEFTNSDPKPDVCTLSTLLSFISKWAKKVMKDQEKQTFKEKEWNFGGALNFYVIFIFVFIICVADATTTITQHSTTHDVGSLIIRKSTVCCLTGQ